ncbi:MAG: 3'-5' exonuclease [Planctomycetes bacterium]|nr:3'-5' exonuclease [Planctomycetota bacterium]
MPQPEPPAIPASHSSDVTSAKSDAPPPLAAVNPQSAIPNPQLPLPTYVAIDFETADYTADSACAVGLVRVENGRVTRRVRQLIRPPNPRVRFTEIHGIRWTDVCDKPTFAEAWPILAPVIEGAHFLVAHNAGFDRKVLLTCCELAGLPPPTQHFHCTVKLARRAFGLRLANLPAVCGFLGITLNHHEPLSDAEGCAGIMLAVLRSNPALVKFRRAP